MLTLSMMIMSLPPIFADQNTVSLKSDKISSVTNSSKNVTVGTNGIVIKGKFYSKKQFKALLDTAIKLEAPTDQNSVGTRALPLVAGIYFIPGIGEVAIAATGVILIGGAVISLTSWAGQMVSNWFLQKAVEEEYQKDKANGVPTDKHTVTSNEPPTTSSPNSSLDLKKPNESTKQRRYYDKNGNADMDIDYSHGGVGHTFPHKHYWNNGQRGNEMPY